MLILLSSSNKGIEIYWFFEDIQRHYLGEAFIETKNLDGETNLKHKSVPKVVLRTFLGSGDNQEVRFLTKFTKYLTPNLVQSSWKNYLWLWSSQSLPLHFQWQCNY